MGASQFTTTQVLNLNGQTVIANPGDWLVTDLTGAPRVLTNAAYEASLAAVREWWYNVLDYRLTTDTDDSAAFQRAHDSVPSGSKIIIPPFGGLGVGGAYTIGTPIAVLRNHEWEGCGPQGTYINPTNNNDVFVIGSSAVNVTGFSIANLGFFPSDANQTAGAMIHIVNAQNGLIERIRSGSARGSKPYNFCVIDTKTSNNIYFGRVWAESCVDSQYILHTTEGQTLVEIWWDMFCSTRNAGQYGYLVQADNNSVGDIEGIHFAGTSIYNNGAGGINLFANGSRIPCIRNIHLPDTILDTNRGGGLLTTGTGIIQNLHIADPWVSNNPGGDGIQAGSQVRDSFYDGGLYLLNGKNGLSVNGAQRFSARPGHNYSNSQDATNTSFGLAVQGTSQEVWIGEGNIGNNAGGITNTQGGLLISGASLLDIDIGNCKVDTGAGTTKLSWAGTTSASRVRVFRALDNTGSNNVFNIKNIGSGSDAATADGFGNYAGSGTTGTRLLRSTATITGNTTLTTTHSYVRVNGSALTVTLPAANSLTAGREYVIKNVNAITGTILAPNGADTIEGASGTNTTLLSAAKSVVRLVTDGVNNWDAW